MTIQNPRDGILSSRYLSRLDFLKERCNGKSVFHLEHVTKPGALLDGAKRFIKPGGQIIISTNNAFGLHFQLKRWIGRYTEQPEHVCFFSPETLKHVFERHGYRLDEMYGAWDCPPFTRMEKVIFAFGKYLFMLAPILAGTLIAVGTPVSNNVCHARRKSRCPLIQMNMEKRQ